MIQYIALGLALDAENKSNNALEDAKEANRRSKTVGDSFVIIRPVDLEENWVKDDPTITGWKAFFSPSTKKKTLNKTPLATISIPKSAILNIEEFEDDNNDKYVRIKISSYTEIYLNQRLCTELRIPGTIEEILKVLNNAN